VTRWPTRRLPRVEYPSWVRVFLPDDWRDAVEDAQWPIETADWRARQRWCVARNEWLLANPGARKQFLDEFVASMSVPEWSAPLF
jgi:hypothetical protein